MADSKKKSRSLELGRHSRGLWYKKYKGRFYYFYRCEDDPQGTFSKEKWAHDKQFIDEGREPPEYDPLGTRTTACTTVGHLCNHWMSGKETLLNAGDLEQRTYDEYKKTCEFLLRTVGKSLPAELCGPQRFEKVRAALARKYNANGQAKRITQIRSVFTTAYEDQLLDNPPNFGRTFRKPKAAAFRKLRNARGVQMFEPEEVKAILAEANVNLKAMILLGLQAGFGNEECATLPRSAIKDGWINWARVKNGIPRRVPLWKETQEALQAAISHAESKGEPNLCFISERGKTYVSPNKNGYRVTGVFAATRDRAKVNKARTFYDLRRTFETVAGETVDQVAVDAIMGHTPSESNMAARYRQRISDERLIAVTDHVRAWLGPITQTSV